MKKIAESKLQKANFSLRDRRYAESLRQYQDFINEYPNLKFLAENNQEIARRKMRKGEHENTYIPSDPIKSRLKILFISHDASLTGAPAVLFEVIKWLKSSLDIEAKIIIGGGSSERIGEFSQLAECLHIYPNDAEASNKIKDFVASDIVLVYANTVASAPLLQHVYNIFGDSISYVAHVHEKEGVLQHFNAETHYILNTCPRIIVVSEDIKSALIARRPSHNLDIVVIPPFIKRDLANYHNDLEESEAVPVVYGCGTIEHRKGFDIFCSTIAKLDVFFKNKFKAIWIGQAATDVEPAYSISKYLVDETVTAIGLHRNPRSLYKVGDIFFLPSREDPFPLACLEAAERELPIVCFDERAGSMASFVRLSGGGLVANYLDADDACLCLRTLIENSVMKYEMGKNAKKYLIENHTTNVVMPKIEAYLLLGFDIKKPVPVRIIVISFGPLPLKNMKAVEGGGLRAWGLATGIAKASQEVNVVVTFPERYSTSCLDTSKRDSNLQVRTWRDEEQLLQQVREADVVIVSYCYGDISEKISRNIKNPQKLILDCYVPIHSEVCARQSIDKINELNSYNNDVNSWSHMLKVGDILLCASDEQKNYYLGLLFGIGHINPLTYKKADNIIIAPFGISSAKTPEVKNKPISASIKNRNVIKILWFGGIYPWFDLMGVIRAVKGISKKIPCHLTVVGARNPFNQHPDFLRIAKDIEQISNDPLYSSVVKIEDWVSYDDRLDWYFDADIIISMNQDGLENRFAWRTRVLDYLWTERSFVTNGGDPISEKLINIGLAHRISSESDTSLADELERVLTMVHDGALKKSLNKKKLYELKAELAWERIGANILKNIF